MAPNHMQFTLPATRLPARSDIAESTDEVPGITFPSHALVKVTLDPGGV